MFSSFILLVALSLGAHTFDIPRDNRAIQHPGLLRFPLKGTHGGSATRNLARRQAKLDTDTQLQGNVYTIDLEIGNPGQIISVLFDTASSELWVNPTCADASDPEYCESFDQYEKSSTFVDLKRSQRYTYGTGWVEFDYGKDDIALGPARLKQQVFGVATESDWAPNGIMGAGPSSSGWDNEYPLIIDSLVEQGHINSRVFSLDIRSLKSDQGAVVFGGIDTKKYSGHLEKIPIVPASSSPDNLTRYWINVDGITVASPNRDETVVFEDSPLTVLLDSGSSLSILPTRILSRLVEGFPSAHFNFDGSLYEVDCSLADINGTIDFTFGNTVINVPYADWIFHSAETCYLGAIGFDDFLPILGTTFLRAAYAVYDWDNRNIHLANNEDCGSNLVPVSSGPDAVPSLEGECGRTTRTTIPTAKPSSLIPTGLGNSTKTTSTISGTETYTITSCPHDITDCAVGSVTTNVISSITTHSDSQKTAGCTHDECHEPEVSKPNVMTAKSRQTDSPNSTRAPPCNTCGPPESGGDHENESGTHHSDQPTASGSISPPAVPTSGANILAVTPGIIAALSFGVVMAAQL